MAALVLLLLFFSMVTHSSGTWCVCKRGGNDKALQMAIDYACGHGADCTQTHQGGRCFNPDTVVDHCNYAVNSYFQNNRQAPTACDFSGVAMVVTSDPSSNGCTYPSSASGTTVTTSPGNTKTPGSTTVTTGGTNTSPYGNNPTNTGVLGGGIGPGLGPAGAGMNDVSHGLMLNQEKNSYGFLAISTALVMVVMWG